MALNKSIKAETLLSGSALKLTDLSAYDSTNPKSIFDTRLVTLTFADSTVINKTFAYVNDINSIQDTITYEDIFTKDSIIEIKVEFVFKDNGIEPEELIFNYLSTIFTLKCRSNLANSICGCDDCHDEYRNLTKIDSNLTSAEYASLFGEEEKAQKFLDKCYDICESLKNKNCKDC